MVGYKKLKAGLYWCVEIEEGPYGSFVADFLHILQFHVNETKKWEKHPIGNHVLRFSIKLFPKAKQSLFQIREVSNPCTVELHYSRQRFLPQMIRLSQFIAACSASRGVILFHGALASWKGKGILLCGASGSGKTTASKRLPSSWRSLSDDAALLVRDQQGKFWAYPWPTWSRYPAKKKIPVQPLAEPVPLNAICFLKKSHADGMAKAPEKEAIVRLMAASEQAVNLTAAIMPVVPRNRQRIDRLDLCCELVRNLPAFRLSASLHGRFWERIEKTLRLQVPQ